MSTMKLLREKSLVSIALVLALSMPAFARVDAYQSRNTTVVGGGRGRGPVVVNNNRNTVIVDRRGPGWGGVAAGVAAGAVIGAAAANASRPNVVVVAPPAYGTVVYGLPGGCVNMAVPGGFIHNCGGVYYRPYYVGTTVQYAVIAPPF
jgi:hypothetical protein